MTEEKTINDDILDQIAVTSENMLGGDQELRKAEFKIYESQTNLLSEREKLDAQYAFEQMRNETERYRIDEEMKLRREFESQRIQIEAEKAKTEKHTLWTKVGLAAAEICLTVGLGYKYLKANLTYGGMVGKDAKSVWDNLRHIKI